MRGRDERNGNEVQEYPYDPPYPYGREGDVLYDRSNLQLSPARFTQVTKAIETRNKPLKFDAVN